MMQFQNRQFVFITGLPRAGSTVLANILAQNTRIRSDAVTSGLVSILSGVQENWEKSESFKSWPNLDAKFRVLQAMFHSYYADSEHPVVVDKNRAWLPQFEMLEMILGEKPKILVCVRDMRAVMASWEKMWRKNKAFFPLNIPPEFHHTVESRVQYWGSSKDHTGKSYLAIQDALHRGHGNSMLFIDFDKFTHDPESQLNRIYDFIREKPFKHDFNRIDQKNIEADPVPWMRDLHLIRSELKPVDSNWESILGAPAAGLAVSNSLWENRI